MYRMGLVKKFTRFFFSFAQLHKCNYFHFSNGLIAFLQFYNLFGLTETNICSYNKTEQIFEKGGEVLWRDK